MQERPEITSIPREADDDSESLPPLPEGMEPLVTIQTLDIEKFVEDALQKSPGKTLSQPDKMRLLHEFTCARARIEIIDSSVRMTLTEGMEKLRSEGSYVEYASGEKCQSVKGVLTVGEQMENKGQRLFYFYPEEFPEVYEKRKEKTNVATLAMRRILSVLQ